MRDITEIYISPVTNNRTNKFIFVAIKSSVTNEEKEYRPTLSSAFRLQRVLRHYQPHRIDIAPYPALTYRVDINKDGPAVSYRFMGRVNPNTPTPPPPAGGSKPAPAVKAEGFLPSRVRWPERSRASFAGQFPQNCLRSGLPLTGSITPSWKKKARPRGGIFCLTASDVFKWFCHAG
jgi:hypothetical protein